MSEVLSDQKSGKKSRSSSFENYIGPMDSKTDALARDRLITARVGLLMKHSFFGNLATRMKLVNSDEWCATAATDGRTFYYNSRFIMALKPKEVEFLFGHEVLHVVYDHIGRREDRDPQISNIAADYAVNADLKRHRVGEFITSVPCLYDSKYDGKGYEYIYEDLMKNAEKIDMNSLIEKMIDEHLDHEHGEGNEVGEGEGQRPKPLTAEEREQLKQEIKQNILNAAKGCDAGQLPAGVQRLIKDTVSPTMPWRELIQTNLTSSIKQDYSFSRPNRRGWHMDAVMPGMTPGEEIDVDIAVDMSGSITNRQAAQFLSEIGGMMQMFDGYRVHVFCFDTKIYNPRDFNSDNLDDISEYELAGGGGTDFDCIFQYLKTEGRTPNRLIVFTDGVPWNSWGDADYCDTTWIIHGSQDIVPPFGTWAYFDEHTAK